MDAQEYAYVVMHGYCESFSDNYNNEPIAVFTTLKAAASYIVANSTKLSKDPWDKERLWINPLPLNPDHNFRTL